jgi:hypothetical protein
MAAAAAPAVAGAASGGGAAAAGAGARAGASGAGAGARGKAATSSGGAGKSGGGAGGAQVPDLPERGSWRKRSEGRKSGKGAASRAVAGSAGKYRRILIAEFIVCVIILGLSPLAKKDGEMGPVRFMKRGSATCGLFVILGLVSAMGRGAGKAAAAFGGLVTVVLLVDQREAFGKLATMLNTTDEDADADRAAALGPDESTDDSGPATAEV